MIPSTGNMGKSSTLSSANTKTRHLSPAARSASPHHKSTANQPNNDSSLKMLKMKKQNDAVPHRANRRLGNVQNTADINQTSKFVSRALVQEAFKTNTTV